MTQREKIEMLRTAIVQLYVDEGRSKSYISRLLEVDRKTLTEVLNNEWKLEQGNASYMTPSNKKFLNKHRNLIKSRLDNDTTLVKIASELKVNSDYLSRTIIPRDEILKKSLSDYYSRIERQAEERRTSQKAMSPHEYDIVDLEGEIWKDILGHEGYMVSNKGRVKSYKETYKDYMLLTPHPNKNNGRLYIRISDKANLQVARLVGFNFVEGHSKESNTINHIDGDNQNNWSDNLEWVSQAENNQHAYDNGRPVVKSYQKYGKFKKIILDDKYEFKTMRALSKFIGLSETQVRRYINGETKDSPYTFKFIY